MLLFFFVLGRAKEYNKPSNLLQSQSLFRALVQEYANRSTGYKKSRISNVPLDMSALVIHILMKKSKCLNKESQAICLILDIQLHVYRRYSLLVFFKYLY